MIGDEAALESRPSADPDGPPARSEGRVRWEPLLSADEERELAGRIQRGDQAARRQLILANLRLVIGIARRFGGSKVPLDDLIQEGNLGLIRASADFDPAVHDCRFYSYAAVWIRAFIHRALIANGSMIRVPQHVFLQRKQYRRVGDATEAGKSGPTRMERMPREVDGIPRRLDPDRPAEPGRIASSYVAGEGEIVPLTEAIVDDQQPEQQEADQERRLLLEVALRRLNPVEAWVIRERYGLCLPIPEERDWSSPDPQGARRDDSGSGPDAQCDSSAACRSFFHRSYIELARDCGLSRHRIQQVEETALEKLREVLRPGLAQAL